MIDPGDHVLTYAMRNRSRFVSELAQFVRFPSVSAQPEFGAGVRRCAAWLATHLKGIGMEAVRCIPTRRHPLVYAEWRHMAGRPTVLMYGHYDVQPADPLSEWRSPPFEPVVRGNDLYGRGASDDKGQLLAHVKALESYLCTAGALPVNVKCLFEGEEEIGSPNLQAFIRDQRKLLVADVALISDMRILAPDRPAITYSLRGMLACEVEVRGPRHDLHSGTFGGAIHNPLQALCDIVAKLHDADGRIAVPGFYDRVRTRGSRERDDMARTGPSDATLLSDAGATSGWGELGYTLYERTTIRPALTINGIVGGYAGAGPKAVIPSRAVAKLSFRLVPDQDPDDVANRLRAHIAAICPATVESTMRSLSSAKPVLVDRQHPAIQAAVGAYEMGFGARSTFVASGGSIPPVNAFQETLGIPTVLMGFALPDDNMHAPNEKFHLPNFFNGIRTSIYFLREVAARRSAIGRM